MIRFLIAGLMVLMVSNANAVKNETHFKYCKQYVENGFKTTDIDTLKCYVYFTGVYEVLYDACYQYQQSLSNLNDSQKSIFEYLAVGKALSLDSAIQHYVDKMQNAPEDWNYSAGGDVRRSLQAMYKCKPE
ncbi:MAG: hypothetical protein ISP40_03680 [Alphaproteobacteria bacterium]|nr:hypothetical protein [Alphaproteobacteria bacterium]